MYDIRKATTEDSVAISRLISTLTHYFTLHPEGKGAETFLKSFTPEAISNTIASPDFNYIVAQESGHVIAAGALKNGSHLFHLFVAKCHHKQGVAKALWQELLTHTDTNREITVNSTPFAVPVYQSLGFKMTGEKVEKNGIAYVPMSLAQAESNS